MLEAIRQMALDSGMYQAEYLDTREIKCYPEVRQTCEGNACGRYGTVWTCPPGVGTLEECRERLMAFDKMLLFSKKYELEDEFDFEGMGEGLLDFKQAVADFDAKIRPVLAEFLLLGNEGCDRCAQCTTRTRPAGSRSWCIIPFPPTACMWRSWQRLPVSITTTAEPPSPIWEH